MKRIDFAIILLCLTMLSNSGCASLGKMPRMPWQEEEPEYKLPTKMVVTWKDAVRYNPNDPPTRGFGGRIHFYDESNKPVQVKGTLTVYGYDDSLHHELDSERPDRKYVFKPESMDGHYSLSKIGHSYSFWIPWDRAGGEQKDITLAPFFRSEIGQVLMSEQSKHVLPGTLPKEKELSPEMSPSDRQTQEIATVGYQRATNPTRSWDTPPNPERMRTTTIHLPTTMETRLRNLRQSLQPDATPVSATPPAPQSFQRSPVDRSFSSDSLRQTGVPPREPSGWQHSLHVKPGLNLQNFRPDFANATQYSEYLATGQPTMAPQAAPGLPIGSQPMISQVPSTQIDRLRAGHPPNPQSPTLWPPGLPQTPSHPGSLGR